MNHPFVDVICAKTPEQKAAEEAMLALKNAGSLSDREIMQYFLNDCTTLGGKPVSSKSSENMGTNNTGQA